MTSPIEVNAARIALTLANGNTVYVVRSTWAVVVIEQISATRCRVTIEGRSLVVVGDYATIYALFNPIVSLDAIDVSQVDYVTYVRRPRLVNMSLWLAFKNAGANPLTYTLAGCVLREDGTEVVVATAGNAFTSAVLAGGASKVDLAQLFYGTHTKVTLVHGAGVGPVSGVIQAL